MNRPKKNVILVHGFLVKAPIMGYLAYKLNKLGYRVHFFNYRTLHFDKESTMRELNSLVSGLDNIYFLGHSMGGLVIREFIQNHPSKKFKAVVTLGSPHKGSKFAKLVSKSELNNLLGINNNSGLISDLEDYKGEPPLGSIAGNKNHGLFKAYSSLKNIFLEEKNSDGTVLVSETIDENFKDHITLYVSHSGMLYSKDVLYQIHYFFTHLCFNHKKNS